MEEQKVKDLSIAQNPKSTDFLMLITNLTNNVLEKVQISALRDLMTTNSISDDEGNVLTTGTDDKLYVPQIDLSTRANLTLSNVTSLSDAIKALLSGVYATKDLSNITTSISGLLTADDKKAIAALSTPDYSQAISKSIGITYTADSSGYLYFSYGNTAGSDVSVTINDVSYGRYLSDTGTYANGLFIPIAKDDTYLVSGRGATIKFIPAKGGN